MLCNWGVCSATNGIHNLDEQKEEAQKLVFNITFWLKPISGRRIQRNKRKSELDDLGDLRRVASSQRRESTRPVVDRSQACSVT